MTFTRRQALSLGGAALATIALPRFGNAAEFSYTFAHGQSATHPMQIRLAEAAARIAEESGGRFELKAIPASQLGSDADMLNQARSGAIQFFATGSGFFSSLIPSAAITGSGFIFKSYEDVWKAMDGDVGGKIRAGFDQHGLHVFDRLWDNGFRQITSSSRQIRTPDDLAGFKIRVPNSPMYVNLFANLGASPATVNINETYTALQTGLVDGQENPVAHLRNFRFFEVQKYCSLTSHMWDGMWITANKAAWEALPADIREIVQRNLDDHAILQREDVAKIDKDDRDWAAGQGVEFLDIDTTPFRQKLTDAGYYAEKKETFGEELWSALESYVGPLG